MRNIYSIFILVLLLVSCGAEGHEKGWQVLDLLPHGVAVSILAPEDVSVKQGRLKSTLVQDLTIKDENNYSIQLFYSQAVTNDIAKLKNDHLQNVRSGRYFSKIVKEEVAGFIYQTMIDTVPNYGFRFVKLQGNQELNFQSGMGRIFSLEDAQMMYEAVK